MLLADQDRSRWDRDRIAEKSALVERALSSRRVGPYTLQAAIAAAHAEAHEYHLAHAVRADRCRRLGRTADARASYERALELTRQEPERRFLERRLDELSG